MKTIHPVKRLNEFEKKSAKWHVKFWNFFYLNPEIAPLSSTSFSALHDDGFLVNYKFGLSMWWYLNNTNFMKVTHLGICMKHPFILWTELFNSFLSYNFPIFPLFQYFYKELSRLINLYSNVVIGKYTKDLSLIH